jgi:sarcosine oxidase delta subunit
MLPQIGGKSVLTDISCSGFEQANKYVIMDAQGNQIGWMAEQEKGLAGTMSRQWFNTHRNFVTHVFDRQENEILRVSLRTIS